MSKELRVPDARIAKEIAIETARAFWKYPLPSQFYKVDFDSENSVWDLEAEYHGEKLIFKIDAVTGNTISVRRQKV